MYADTGTQTEHQGAEEPEKTVLVIGATGTFGALIARALLDKVDEGVNLRLLVRPGSRDKLAADVAEKSEVVENETDAFDGVHTVVSAVRGGPETIVDSQLEWLRAARG